MHITDLHIACPDETDEDRIIELEKKRREKYPFCVNILAQTAETARRENALPLITGDIMDCYSHGSAKAVKEFTESTDCLFVAGNHDFRIFGGMEYDVPSSREINLANVSALFKNDIRFFSKEINGVNIVGIDNAYYRFEEYQVERLKTEVQKSLPIILALHVPLYTPECFDLMITEKRRYASLVCVPESAMQIYPQKRYEQQKEDAATRRMYDFILTEPLIKLVLCGHIHKNFETALPDGTPQFITGTDTARIVQIL